MKYMNTNTIILPSSYLITPSFPSLYYCDPLILQSPYLILPSSPSLLYFDPKLVLAYVLDELSSEEKNQDLIQVVTGKVLIRYHKLVVGEFYRQTIDSNFPYWKPNRKLKPIIQLEVNLWQSVLKMLKHLFYRNSFIDIPEFSFYKLIREREFMVFIVSCTGGQLRVKDYLAMRQHQNRELQGCENPFDREKSPCTWGIMNSAIRIAERDDEFSKNFYMPVIRDRQKFTAFMKSEKFRAFLEGKIRRQGRRKEL